MAPEPNEQSVGRDAARRALAESRARSGAADRMIAESRALVARVGERHTANHFTDKIRRIIQGSR